MNATLETPTARKARKEALLAKAAAAPKATKVAEMSNAAPAPAKEKAPKVTEIRMCICHCGEPTTNQFRQGHDARGKGQLIRWMKEHEGTFAGFPNDELVAYALAGGFQGRFLGTPTKAPAKAKTPRTKAAA